MAAWFAAKHESLGFSADMLLQACSYMRTVAMIVCHKELWRDGLRCL